MDLYYLIYSSSPVRTLSEQEMHDLLLLARRENEAHQVTGMLLCLQDMYIQLIEGPKNEIEQLFKNIEKDIRHFQVNVLKEGPIKTRFFPAWSMGLDVNSVSFKEMDAVDIVAPESMRLLEILQYL